MSEEVDFATFLARVRQGDAAAAEELVRRYEPAIRLEVRRRLRDPRYRRLFDSTDVCQSVLASFFVRAGAGLYDLTDSKDLVRLLVTMARHKAIAKARHHEAGNRDHRLVAGGEVDLAGFAAANATPSEVVANRDLLERVRALLSPEERELSDRRGRGQDWAQIAAELGGTAQGRRKQLERAIQRAARQLGVHEPDDEDE